MYRISSQHKKPRKTVRFNAAPSDDLRSKELALAKLQKLATEAPSNTDGEEQVKTYVRSMISAIVSAYRSIQ